MADPSAVLPPGLLARLQRAYATPPRHYHTLAHARVVATTAAALGGSRACLLAAWAHDVVYDSRGEDNEEQSARWLLQALPHDPDRAEAARLVRCTADHIAQPDDRQAGVLCDADLSVLGRPPEAYEAYRQAVRREYAHLDERNWRTGRARVLEGLLGRPQLFHSLEAIRRWEEAARRNMTEELAAL